MKWNKLYFPAAILGLLALSILGIFAYFDEEEVVRYQISIIVDNSSHGKWNRFRAGLENASDDFDVSLNYVMTESLTDTEQEIKLISNEISAGCDAVIVQFAEADDEIEAISDIDIKTTLVIVANPVDVLSTSSSMVPVICPDGRLTGAAAAEKLLENSRDEALRVGIISGSLKQNVMQERLDGFMNVLSGGAAEAVWVSESGIPVDAYKNTDVLAALDNESLEAAVDYVLEHPEADIRIYGIGGSDKTVYWLDHGEIDAMVVTDDFTMAYSAVKTAVDLLKYHDYDRTEKVSIGFAVVTKENMYSYENQHMLFPEIH